MGEFIEEKEFNEFAMPCMVTIATEMRKRHPTIPLLNFPRDAMYGVGPCQVSAPPPSNLQVSAPSTTLVASLTSLAAARGSASQPHIRAGATHHRRRRVTTW
jgi:hypothetical protein